MFEFLFKYPAAVFSKGTFVLAGGWPLWLLWALIFVAAAALGAVLWMRRSRISPSVRGAKPAIVWLLQTGLVALLLLLLWQPALSVATLKPQQNIVAVVVDDSRSMAAKDTGISRRDEAVRTLNNGLIKDLQQKFQVRLYRIGDHVERIAKTDQLTASEPATHLGSDLKEIVGEAATLPIGAIVLLSDGSDNSGGIDLETLSEIRRRRLPVHTIGFGREQFGHDIELTDIQIGRAHV